MSKPNTIARPEIAKLPGISVAKLINVIRCTDTEAPKPIGKVGRQLVYDRAVMLDWIATDPLANITWRQRAKKSPAAKLAEAQTADLTRAFLSGNMGVSKAQRIRYQMRKLVAKHFGQRKSSHVEVRGGDYDDTGRRDQRAGLV